jgi:hypothetical protein
MQIFVTRVRENYGISVVELDRYIGRINMKTIQLLPMVE